MPKDYDLVTTRHYNFPSDPPPLRKWETCKPKEKHEPLPKEDMRWLSELTPREYPILESQCDEVLSKRRPYWYLGDVEDIIEYDQNDYMPITIYDRLLPKTLQPTKIKDWVEELNIENESVVPGYSLVERCDNSLLEECQEDPFIRDRKQWVASVKDKVKIKPPARKCDVYDHSLPYFCNDAFYGPEPEVPVVPAIPKLSFEEWLEENPLVRKPDPRLDLCHVNLVDPNVAPEKCHWYRMFTVDRILNPPEPKSCPKYKVNEPKKPRPVFCRQHFEDREPPNNKNTFKYSLRKLLKE